jgi:hypothetical protein
VANSWVYRISDGLLMMGFGLDPSVYLTDQVNYAIVSLPETASPPNPRLHRAVNATTIRSATAQEQADYDLLVADVKATSYSKDRNELAALAMMAEAYNPNWAGWTNAQRKTEVLRLSSRLDQWRRWVERNSLT